jgi:phage terminase large subunit-like protein
LWELSAAVAVGNARVEPKGNAIPVTKQASSSAKLDPLMAAFNCHRVDVNVPLVLATEHLRI